MFVSDEGTGPAVLFVHGQPGLGSDFDAVAALLEADHRLIAPDRPGYGASQGPPLSMAENARVLADLLEERRAVPATVVGHSYGGGIAILLAAARPELVSGLVLAGSVGSEESLSGVDRVLATPVIGDALSAATLFTFGLIVPKAMGVARFAVGRVARLRAALPDSSYLAGAGAGRAVWRTFVFEQRALMSEIQQVESSLELLGAPTAVMSGEWDFVVPPVVARSIAAQVKGATLVTVPQVGHFLPRDAPAAMAGAVRSVEERAGISNGSG
jgi:pimeloyl-ACP methyl ester carboxylesterase